jgi:hypothetical protein
LKTFNQVTEAVQKVLEEHQVARWIKTEVKVVEEDRFTQATRGRPGPQTAYVRQKHQSFSLHWQSDAQALLDEAQTDGIFPLITNDENMSVKEVLLAYKHQPALEKTASTVQVRPPGPPSDAKESPAHRSLFVSVLPCAADRGVD